MMIDDGGCGGKGDGAATTITTPTASFNDDKLDSIATLLASKKNIIVLVGAGISVAAGIPDFRSPTTGLYNTINHVEYGLSSPEELFDIDIFTDNPTPFYKFAKSFGYYNETGNNTKHKPTISHYFLAQLAKNKQLRRIYTQNIDGLEILAGVSPSKIVNAHGSLANGAVCMKCSALYTAYDIAEDVRFGRVPLCTRSRSHTQQSKPRKNKIVKLAEAEAATAATLPTPDYNSTTNYDETLSSTTSTITVAVTEFRKRTSTRLAEAMISSSTIAGNKSDCNHDDDNNVLRRRSLVLISQHGLCGGVIKPNITFFGEKLNNQVGQWLQKDCNVADALLVIGTSLSVAPMSKVVHYLRSDIPRILINRTIVQIPKVSNNEDDGCLLFHTCLLGDCDVIAEALSHRMLSRHCSGNKGKGIATTLGGVNHDSQRGDKALGYVQPKESILLFEGAESVNNTVALAVPPTTTLSKTIAHCDECQHEIQGQIYNCKTCFDYDLCRVCYLNPLVIHANGKHEFAIEG